MRGSISVSHLLPYQVPVSVRESFFFFPFLAAQTEGLSVSLGKQDSLSSSTHTQAAFIAPVFSLLVHLLHFLLLCQPLTRCLSPGHNGLCSTLDQDLQKRERASCPKIPVLSFTLECRRRVCFDQRGNPIPDSWDNGMRIASEAPSTYMASTTTSSPKSPSTPSPGKLEQHVNSLPACVL